MQNKGKNPLSEVKKLGIIHRAREFLNPQYFDCISIGASIAIFSDSSLLSIDYDDDSEYQSGIKLPEPYPWRGSLWAYKQTPHKLAGFWPKTVVRVCSWNHNVQNIKQIAWSDSIYNNDRYQSILFVLDTNFQLSLYNHQFELIYDLSSHHIIPTNSKLNDATEYINNIQNASNLCFAFTKSFGRNKKGKNIIVALGGRSDSLKLFQLTFSYPETTPTVIELNNIALGLRKIRKDKVGKYRQVVSLSWKHIKKLQNEEKEMNYFFLVIGFNDGSLRYILLKIVEKVDKTRLSIHKRGPIVKVLKADFASIENISFSKIFVQSPTEGLHLFALVVKQFVYCIVRFTIQFDSDSDELTQNEISVDINTNFRIIRPFESQITVARWLNHSLGIITASRSYQIRYWQAGVDLSINLESDVPLPVKKGNGITFYTGSYEPPIYGLEVSPNDALLIIYTQNSFNIDTIELSSSPVDYFHPIEKLLRTQVDPSQGYPFNSWDLAIKFSSKPFHEIFGVINHIKLTFLESYEDKSLTQNVIHMIWRIYQVIILLCQSSGIDNQPEKLQHQMALYVVHHAHVAYLLSICRNLNELKKMIANQYKLREEEKVSLWNMRLQIKQRLNKLQESTSSSIQITLSNNNIEIDQHSDDVNQMEVIGEIEEINEEIAEHFDGDDLNEDAEAPELPLELFPFPSHQIGIECLLAVDMNEKCAFIDSLIGDYQVPPLHCPYCRQLVDYTTMMCNKNHCVELCMRTFQPLINARSLLKCHTCNVSALDLSESNSFGWVYYDDKCAISGHKIHKIKYS
jgi:hypothetical protein